MHLFVDFLKNWLREEGAYRVVEEGIEDERLGDFESDFSAFVKPEATLTSVVKEVGAPEPSTDDTVSWIIHLSRNKELSDPITKTMNVQLVVGGGLVVGLGVLAYFASGSDTPSDMPAPPPVVVQPSWTSEQVDEIAANEISYQESVIVSGSVIDVIAPTNPYTISTPTPPPPVPVYTYVQPVEQDPSVQAYLDSAATATKPSYAEDVTAAPWYLWTNPVTAIGVLVGAGVEYDTNNDAYNSIQAGASAIQTQLKKNEETRLADEAKLNFQSYYDYESASSLYGGSAFNWDATVQLAAYLQVNDTEKFDAFLGAWDQLSTNDAATYQAQVISEAPTPPPKPVSIPGESKDEQEQELQDYQTQYSLYQSAWKQWQDQLKSTSNVALNQQVAGQIFSAAYDISDSDAQALGGVYLQTQQYQGPYAGVIQTAFQGKLDTLPTQSISSPTYTLSDGSVVEVYSGLVVSAGTQFQVGDEPFQVTSGGDIVSQASNKS
jgi:hypothetical protein